MTVLSFFRKFLLILHALLVSCFLIWCSARSESEPATFKAKPATTRQVDFGVGLRICAPEAKGVADSQADAYLFHVWNSVHGSRSNDTAHRRLKSTRFKGILRGCISGTDICLRPVLRGGYGAAADATPMASIPIERRLEELETLLVQVAMHPSRCRLGPSPPFHNLPFISLPFSSRVCASFHHSSYRYSTYTPLQSPAGARHLIWSQAGAPAAAAMQSPTPDTACLAGPPDGGGARPGAGAAALRHGGDGLRPHRV